MLLFAITTMIIIIVKIPIIIIMGLLFISLRRVADSLSRKFTEITITTIAKIILTRIISMNQLGVNILILQIAQQA